MCQFESLSHHLKCHRLLQLGLWNTELPLPDTIVQGKLPMEAAVVARPRQFAYLKPRDYLVKALMIVSMCSGLVVILLVRILQGVNLSYAPPAGFTWTSIVLPARSRSKGRRT